MNEKPLEIIVVDSSSTDNTSKLAKIYPMRYVSIPEKNRQRARNIGLSQSKGDVVAFIDDDVAVDENWSTNILTSYTHSNIGGVGGRVIPHGATASYFIKTKKNETGKIHVDGLILGNFDALLPTSIEVDHLNGCNMSFRKDLLMQVGGFDENFMGNSFRDDTDASLRIRKASYKLIYQPKALVWHKFMGRVVDEKWAYWYIRNGIYFYFKNRSSPVGFYFPQCLLRLVLLPQEYVKKSQLRLTFRLSLILAAIRGVADGFVSIRNKRRLWRFL
jgi:GT2 family glycosyltransferase